MAEAPLERRFRGSVQLVTLHLWRAARSTDLEDGFRVARELSMLRPEHEAFLRRCLALSEALEAGEPPIEPLTEAMVTELQACALRLNTADPA